MKKFLIVLMLAGFLGGVLCGSAYGGITDLYAMGLNNQNIYQIDPSTGVVTVVSTVALYPSIGIASDGQYLYYWNCDAVTKRGIARWNPITDTHVPINTTDLSEENACFGPCGTIWLLDRSNSYDPPVGFLHDDTRNLYTINKTDGTRTLYATLPNGGVGGLAVGDIAWGPDGKLYISTHNSFWPGYGSVENFVWDPVTNEFTAKGGVYHAGLAWIGDKFYGSRTPTGGDTGLIFELNPVDFSEIVQVATMPVGVTIGDLATGVVPEPATVLLLGFGGLVLCRRRNRR